MSLPIKFVEQMRELYKDKADDFFHALNKDNVKALSCDTNKLEISKVLEHIDSNTTKVDGVEDAYYYTGKIGDNILHHAGVLYSQDASAMFPVEALGVELGDIVLDLCASPGGKTIQILKKLNNTGLLVTNEYEYKRAKVLYENLTRFGYQNYCLTNNSPRDFDDKYAVFDKILVDAPCSGEGMFRRGEEAKYSWSEKNVEMCAVRQTEILNSIAPLLKVGGRLVYSTCTYNLHENEEVILKFIKEHKDYRLCPLPVNVMSNTSRGYVIDKDYDTSLTGRREPHVFIGEGQFVALLERVEGSSLKTSDNTVATQYSCLNNKEKKIVEKEISSIINLDQLRLLKKGNNIYAIPKVDFDYTNLNVLSLGVCVGTFDKEILKLNHAFYKAYGNMFATYIDLDYEQAKVYLTGNVVELCNPQVSGIVAVKYLGITLGGGKIVNGVLKNYYPKELRNK